MNVVIRKRQKHKKGNIILFLDIIDQFGNRKQVSLGKFKIFLYPNPSTDIEKQTNKRNLQLAEAIRAKYLRENICKTWKEGNSSKSDYKYFPSRRLS